MELPTDQAPAKPRKLTKCETVQAEIQKYSGWDASIMFAIAQAENRTCEPTNHNLSPSEDHGVCIGSYGVLQVGCVHYAGQNIDDLKTNIAIAHSVWQKQGYNAWTQYNNGAYRDFLN